MSDTVKMIALEPISEGSQKYQIGDVLEVSRERAERFELLKIARVVEVKKQVEAPPKDKMVRGTKVVRKKRKY